MDFRKSAFILIGLTIVLATIILLLFLNTTKLDSNQTIDTTKFADYGTIVGGLSAAALSIASIFLIIQTLNDQQKNFQRQSIETRFFELLKFHRENNRDIQINEKSGIKVFVALLREFYKTLEIVNITNLKREKILDEPEVLNISYTCFFFGAVGTNSEKIIRHHLKSYTDEKHPNFIDVLIESFKDAQERIISEEKFDYKPFEGHQSRFSRYFRHLYQTVKFINEQPSALLNYQEKYGYIKTLRAQLSTQEQSLLFFNSLSELGKPWEKKSKLPENKKLITKYNLIKNIPTGFTHEIEIRRYYENVQYEGDKEKSKKRKELEANYD